jgi:hypothetical protein
MHDLQIDTGLIMDCYLVELFIEGHVIAIQIWGWSETAVQEGAAALYPHAEIISVEKQ